MKHSIELLVQIVILLPATYIGVLYLLEEDGPFNVFTRIRKLAGFKEEVMSKLAADGSQVEYTVQVSGDNFWSRVLDCHRCLSPYVSFLVVLLGLVIGFLQLTPLLFLTWLGLIGSTVFIFELLGD